MTFIQRFFENIAIGIVIFTFLAIQLYNFNPFVHSANYQAISKHTHLIPQKNVMNYNTSQQCISYWIPDPIVQRKQIYY